MNLCANAAHAMQENGGVLEVRLFQVILNADFANKYPDMKQGQYVKMSFKDTGHGIPPEVRDSIFNPYFTTKEKGEGTGLGLAVVHGIVKNFEGEITVDSEPGKGSIFDVYLPVIEDEEQESIKPIEPLHTGHENVLVVDDEPGIVEMGGRMLESLGYQVTTRTSSIEALELFKHEPGRFELIITDMTMPNMTGDRFSQEVMKIRPDIPIILCTGYSHQISEEKAKKIGIKAFVMKPLVKRELSSIVRQVLES
jgi:CheY-like chemotaxis protein